MQPVALALEHSSPVNALSASEETGRLATILMNVQSSLPGVGTMQSATTTQGPSAVSAWRATTSQTGEYVWLLWTNVPSTTVKLVSTTVISLSEPSASIWVAPPTPVPVCLASLGMAEPAKTWMNASTADVTLMPSATTHQAPSDVSASLAIRGMASDVCLERWAKRGVNWNESTSLEQPGQQMHSGPHCRGCLYPSVMNMGTIHPPSATTALATAGVWTEMVRSWRVPVLHQG